MVDAVVAVVSYCTSIIGKSVVPHSVVVSKVTIIFAATKRKACIVAAIQASAIATTQPNAIAAGVIDGIAGNEIVLWCLVTYSAAFAAVPVEVDASVGCLLDGVGQDLVVGRSVDGDDFPRRAGDADGVVADDVTAALGVQVDYG